MIADDYVPVAPFLLIVSDDREQMDWLQYDSLSAALLVWRAAPEAPTRAIVDSHGVVVWGSVKNRFACAPHMLRFFGEIPGVDPMEVLDLELNLRSRDWAEGLAS